MVRKIKFSKINNISGTLYLPGDKSISHRALIFSAMADGVSIIENLSNSEDVKSTKKCLAELGADIWLEDNLVKVKGVGFKGFRKPKKDLDAGNSGTTARLLSGLLTAQDFESKITGDESLSSRPMKRIIDPLIEMGSGIKSTEKFTLPVEIFSSKKLKSISYTMPVASAQVKSALILAGLHLDVTSEIIEEKETRDHTERMLGLKVEKNSGIKKIYFSKKDYPTPKKYFVPSDISTASFFIVLGLLTKNSELTIKNISLNRTRTGLLNILKKMGADIEVTNRSSSNSEEFGDLIVKSSKLKNIEIEETQIPNIIDEIPILAIAGIFAEGEFKISGAEELRFKESDRINAVCSNLKLLGLDIHESKDGFTISGSIKNSKTEFDSLGDHRIAMSFAILSSLLDGDYSINNFECVKISNPQFLKQLEGISFK